MDVAETALAAPGDNQGLVSGHEIAEESARGVFEDAGAGRHFERQVVAGLAVHPRSSPAASGLALEVMGAAVVAQTRLAGVHSQVYRTTAAAVAAVRAAARDVGFTPERGRAVAAVAGMHEDSYSVEEHGSILAPASARQRGAG